eukprot:SAG11_NODE_1927_length_4054_cov_4.221492_1_plen_23_part_10
MAPVGLVSKPQVYQPQGGGGGGM